MKSKLQMEKVGDKTYNISSYKSPKFERKLKLVELEPEKQLSILESLQKKMGKDMGQYSKVYKELTYQQKVTLHTIAPLWANLIQHDIYGSITVQSDEGETYKLASCSPTSCLVGEAYGFSHSNKCGICHNYNMNFASIGREWVRKRDIHVIGGFLDHYYESHLKQQLS